jgi:cytidine deaminase
MLYAPERRLLDAAVNTASRLPADGTYLNTVASAVMDVHGDIYSGVNGRGP